MLKNDYPIYFNQTKILIPATWKESWDVVETVAQSESGRDVINKSRDRKLTVNCTFNVTDTWFRTFAQFSQMDSFELKRYEPMLLAYQTHEVRIRNFQPSVLRKSWDLDYTNGVWTIGFIIKEF